MDYTDQQYALIEKLEKGLNYWRLSDQDQDVLRYLDKEGIAQPRAYIADGYYELSEPGKQVLAEHRRKIHVAKIEVQQKLQDLREQELIRAENIRREKACEQKQLKQAVAEKAERKAEKRADRIFQILLTVLQAFLTFVTGLLAEHFLGVIDFICSAID